MGTEIKTHGKQAQLALLSRKFKKMITVIEGLKKSGKNSREEASEIRTQMFLKPHKNP